jgi:hypothetical protein
MHLTLGADLGNWNPHSHTRMLHAISVCIATFVSRNHSWFPLCFFNRTIPKQISEVFSVKCDIKANASATQDFSPKPIAKIKRKNDSTKKKCKKFGFLHFGVNYKCGLLYPTN